MIASQEHQRYSYSSALQINLTKFIFIYLLNMSIQAQNLEYSDFFGNFIYKNDWIIQGGNGVSVICGSSKIFGGNPNFVRTTQIIKSIELPLHTTLQLNFQFWHIDNWGGEKMEVIVDNRLVYRGYYNSECTQPSICGHPGVCWGDGVNLVNIDIAHFDQIAKIIIIGYESYWGISEFQVWTNSGCSVQDRDPFDGCFQGRYECVQGCKDCIRGICIECQSGWEYHVLSQTCQHICGDQMIISIEECDDGNELEYDGCFNCKYSCPLFCKQCEFGKCLKCQSNYNLIDQRCEEIYESQDSKSQDNFSMINQISNFLDQGNYGQVKK